MFATVAAAFIVVFSAVFLFKDIFLTPSRMDSSTKSMAAKDQQADEAESAEYSGAGQSNGNKEVKKAESASEFKVAAAAENNDDVAITFNDSIKANDGAGAGASTTESRDTADTKLAGAAKAKVATADTTTASTATTEKADTSDTSELPMLTAATARLAPEKRVASFTIASADSAKTVESLEKLVANNSGEKVLDNEKTMGITTTSQTTDVEAILEYKIPNKQYEIFKEAVLSAYGQTDVEAAVPEKEDLAATLDVLTKQYDELDMQIKKIENKEVEVTKEELTRAEGRKKQYCCPT